MKPAPRPSLLTPEHIAMVNKGVSTIVASRDAGLRPSLMRAVGSCVSDDGARVTVFLARSQSRQLLQDLADNSHIAVVFSQPSTHRTVQVKASRLALRPATEADLPLLQRYLAAMQEEIALVGHGPRLVQAMLAFRLDDVVAVSFTPDCAFDQTPGPRAGAQLVATA